MLQKVLCSPKERRTNSRESHSTSPFTAEQTETRSELGTCPTMHSQRQFEDEDLTLNNQLSVFLINHCQQARSRTCSSYHTGYNFTNTIKLKTASKKVNVTSSSLFSTINIYTYTVWKLQFY